MQRTQILSLAIATAAAFPVSAQVNWSQLAGTGAPRPFGASAWDTARNRLVHFGGEQGSTTFDATLEWNGTAWTTLNPAVRPSARRRPAMAYDATRNVVVLFGGGSGNQFLADTWTWNGTTWTQQNPANAPSPRFGAAMAFDQNRQVAVLFGGFVPSGNDTGDVWEWDGSTWSPRPTLGQGPGARGAHRLAYDAARGVTVLTGGYSSPAQSTLADTWTWDGTVWTQRGAGPGSICDQVFAWDPTRQRVVLWGGFRVNGTQQSDLSELWEWDGSAWAQRTTAAAPAPRNSGSVGFDPQNGRVLLAGGANGAGTQFTDTWALRPTAAAEAAPFGTGCSTTAGPVTLTATSWPYLGLDFIQTLDAGPAITGIGLVAFGLSDSVWGAQPLPYSLQGLGAPGCTLLVSPDVTLLAVLSNGAGTVTWSLPNLPQLAGVQLFTQGSVYDPALPGALQLGLSRGLRLRLGNP